MRLLFSAIALTLLISCSSPSPAAESSCGYDILVPLGKSVKSYHSFDKPVYAGKTLRASFVDVFQGPVDVLGPAIVMKTRCKAGASKRPS